MKGDKMSVKGSVMTAARMAAVALVSWSIAVVPAAAAPVSVGSSGWLWGDPFPQGETLNQVAFDGARGYTVGERGTVLRSDDSGRTWIGLSSGTETDLTLLQEVDPSTVLVGGDCTVRESTDAGASFHRLAVNASEQGCTSKIVGLSFLSASTGYVEQADGTVLITTDGGQSVQQRTSVPLGGATAEQIYFRSASVGFAVVSGPEGGRIYRTTDGAGSWTQVGAALYGEPLFSVDFAGPTTVYAVGGGLPPTFKGPPGYNGTMVLVSEDEGKTWEERKPGSEPKSVKLPIGTPPLALRQIACIDELHCVIATGTSALVHTSDGTVTGSLVTPSSENMNSVALTTGGDVVAVGQAGTTALSTDGGATFSQLSHGLTGEFKGVVRLGATAQQAYVAGSAGALAATSDGGADWAVLHVPTSADLVDVAFATPQIGYAVDAHGTAFRTANGGASWSILGGGEAPSSILAPSASSVLLVGPTGLRRSSNSGATISGVGGSVVVGRRKHRPVRRSLSSFPLFAGAEQAGTATIVWGDEAIESTDGGAHWKLIPRPLSSGIVEGLSFVNPTTGYVLSRQRLFFTRNSGKSWREISGLGIQPQGGEGDMSFSSASDGYVIGTFRSRHDVVLRTGDGGVTWAPEILPRGVESVTAGGEVDYAKGAGGSLFLTADGGLDASASSLTLALAGPHKLARAKLHRRHGRVSLSGRLSPAQGGERVTISYRTAGRSVWTHRDVTVASDGGFSLTVGGIASSTSFVAQWAGASPLSGAGSAVATLVVTRR
jgi:photosystem II stability/assembly factor-like uncharacterized protein